jgi:hypothetical protein
MALLPQHEQIAGFGPLVFAVRRRQLGALLPTCFADERLAFGKAEIGLNA